MQSGFELPLVSVIIPAYNAEAFIEITLKSVIKQTYKNIEVLVVDDGSLDRTAEIVKSIAMEDKRITLLQQSNAGAASARNKAIAHSKGEYIAPIDADDIWYPENLEKQVQCMLSSEQCVGLTYAWSVHIDEEGLLTGRFDYSRQKGKVYIPLIMTNFLGNGSACLIRRSCLQEVKGYNCRLHTENAQGCEDWDIYLRIAERYEFQVIPDFLIGYRQRFSSMSSNLPVMFKSYILVIGDVQTRHPEIPSRIYQWSASIYYMYLSYKNREAGKHWSCLICLYKSLKIDNLSLLHWYLYKHTLINLIEWLAKPITLFIWKDNLSWQKFKRQFRYRYYRSIEMAELNHKLEKRQHFFNLYERLQEQRLTKFAQDYSEIC
ncbi:glycosyltransferase family 2 protein [Plectonema radiosum NIES-515]|uniref:Glycosyltransferase family 2 protein n=1 Tax=Plectonema radiosum NIES-515 TaxID=2986073 RepID=A0ABT3AU64_9CYAN|nr:glycosyltransferase family 2 protein [Plectonema radiosum]MCV3212590.1 glycosyltransferase family 2 protein [Plectonema radiosum NIES-515]